MTAKEIIDLSVEDRRSKIIAQVKGYESIEDELEKAILISDVINTFIEEYIALQVERDDALGEKSILKNSSSLKAAIDAQFTKFLPIAIEALREEYQKLKSTDPKNVYELSGAYKLAFASNATRTLSTTMGLFLESVASISPYAINPESEFGIKVKGIDLIAKNCNTDLIEYQQMKTQRNTLTGSQKERVVKELSLHENPVVCASFPLNSWTFKHGDIARVAGADFWSRIGMPYDTVQEEVGKLIRKIEGEYIKILEDE